MDLAMGQIPHSTERISSWICKRADAIENVDIVGIGPMSATISVSIAYTARPRDNAARQYVCLLPGFLWYSLRLRTEGWPGWVKLITYRGVLSVCRRLPIPVLTVIDVQQLHWSRATPERQQWSRARVIREVLLSNWRRQDSRNTEACSLHSDGFLSLIVGNSWRGASLRRPPPRAARFPWLSCRNYPQRLFTTATRWQAVNTPKLPKKRRSVCPQRSRSLTRLTRLTRLTGSVHRTASCLVIAKWRWTDRSLLGQNDCENHAWSGTPWESLKAPHETQYTIGTVFADITLSGSDSDRIGQHMSCHTQFRSNYYKNLNPVHL